MESILELVQAAKNKNASDIHIVAGIPIKFRLDGQLESYKEEKINADACWKYVRELCQDSFTGYEKDLALTIDGIRCRIHIYLQQSVPSITLRLLQDTIPDLESLHLPKQVEKVCSFHKGIVLVTGETGSGKSTTLAAIIDRINHQRKAHIVTLEDPIEYIYQPDLCIINQREVGKDTESFYQGLRASLREDPDVILIGEMRDKETIETAITAAETGHLVLATLHTASASESIDRIVQVFPDSMQNQIRLQLSMVLQAVISQQLLPKIHGGRIVACEYMLVNNAIRNNIRQGNPNAIENTIFSGKREFGTQTMDQALVDLVHRYVITKDVAYGYAKNTSFLDKYI